SGSSIAQYAATWLGKIPYVWGGTSLGPAGADCSGFTQAVYHHFNINAPRRSEDQGSWVQRSGPVPGGLAFYHSPPGGADPGHVAIVGGGGNVISQGGGMGPTVEALNFLPLLWTGIPPGGFPGGGGGGTTGGSMSAAAVAALWDQMGGAPSAAGNMAQIAFFESGDNPSAIQQGQPPATTGWGLYQITPTSGITQNGAYGNLLNAANNTKAAISLFNQDGYRPWASDPIGFQLASAPFGFARGGRIPGFRAGGSVNTGGLIPGYALGGLPGLADGAYITPSFPATVATDIAGANFLQAWTTRHGGGPGADWGPFPVNLQIDAANARLKSDSVLAKAAGLTNAQHTMYAARAAADKVNITRQLRELGIMRQWRLDLEAQQANANSYVAAAGSTPGLAGNVRTWKSQAAWDQATIDKVSFMLGLNAAQIAAAIAAGQLGPGGLPLPGITHQFGGDLVNGILTFLHSVSAPLGAAAGMKIGSYDSGGHLPPGLSMAWNGTGRPEPVGFGGGPAAITLEVDDAGGSAFEQFMAMTIRKYVKVRSGGNVQRAFGTPGTVSGSSNWRNG
ncbi:MAG TPA: NlpC/P60 family protein, partial [Streptosporangiaceae bacterium]|nr:NlpC/P60 family protein [Streptosporangiaceae bacterium]